MLKKILNKCASTILYIFLAYTAIYSIPSYSLEVDHAKRILSLVDYIGDDYKNAVLDRTIINEDEYSEMIDFSSEAANYFNQLHKIDGDIASIGSDIKNLSYLIVNKADTTRVAEISSDIKQKLIISYNLKTYPSNLPSIKLGEFLYVNNCSHCHGVKGYGDGNLSHGLTPKPANFQDKDFIENISPFKIFNTTKFGISGTAMPSFPQLSDEDKWNIAFYILTLRYDSNFDQAVSKNKALVNIPEEFRDYKLIASSSDADIRQKLTASNIEEGKFDNTIKSIRLGVGSVLVKSENKDQSLLLAGNLLSEAVKLYENDKKDEAYSKAIDAYLDGFEQVENQLALKDRALTKSLENKFNEFRGKIKTGKDKQEVVFLYNDIKSDLTKASLLLTNVKPLGKLISFLQSFAIIVREGLEAVLIVVAIIAFLATTGAKSAIRYVHYGWVAALAAGLITWILAQTVISITSAQREIIEGATSLIAAAVLFYVSYWFITKIEVQKWKEFIEGRVKKALTKKNVFALASVSFFAVYREAFETVLFYQALWLQTENSKTEVIWGFLAGSVLLVILFVVIFKLGLKIPLRYFFSISSFLLYLLSFILVGKGIREFQEAGFIGITPLEYIPNIDVLGIYPTLQTSLPQGFLLLAFIFAVVWVLIVKQERERKEIVFSVTKIAEDMKTMHEAFDHIKGHIIEWRRCEDIDIEAEDLDKQIHDVITYVDNLENKLVDFFDIVSKNRGNNIDRPPS